MSSGFVTSVGTTRVVALPASFAVCSRWSTRRPARTTLQPSFASASEQALPIPLLAPVMTAIFCDVVMKRSLMSRNAWVWEQGTRRAGYLAIGQA